jgi:thiol-disulfide isomerase/thioredoxin
MEMKHWIMLLVLATAGCASTSTTVTSDPSERGWVGRDLFRTPPYRAFAAGLDTSLVEGQFVPLIKLSYEGERVVIIFGPWCGDSQREVPKFLKLADAAGIEADSIRLYSVDRSKKSDDGITEQYQIERVPTFIIEKNGREVGRIVESPETTMAADLLSILASAKK